MAAHEWKTGNNGTEYYIDTANGKVMGSISDAKLGLELYKVNFGGGDDFLYQTKAKAKAAVEKLNPAPTVTLQAMSKVQMPAAGAKPVAKKSGTKPKP